MGTRKSAARPLLAMTLVASAQCRNTCRVGSEAAIWHAEKLGAVLNRRKCLDYRRKKHVRSFSGRTQEAVGAPHAEARHSGRSGHPSDEQGWPQPGPVTGIDEARVVCPVAAPGVPRAVGLARGKILRRPSPLLAPTGPSRYPRSAATTDRACSATVRPIRNAAGHDHRDRRRDSEPVSDLLRPRMAPGFRPGAVDRRGMSKRRSGAPSGDGFAMTAPGAS